VSLATTGVAHGHEHTFDAGGQRFAPASLDDGNVVDLAAPSPKQSSAAELTIAIVAKH
jgi:hypothetical protein